MLTIRLPEETDAVLANLAKSTGKPKSYHVREALIAYLSNAQQYKHWQASGETTLAAAQDALNNVGEYQYDMAVTAEDA